MKIGPAELQAARAGSLADVVDVGLRILFVGINPGLYSAALGHNFGRPGNRFWAAVALSGMTPTRLQPAQERDLLRYGLGITNIVARPTARAEELTPEELEAGAELLERKVARLRPRAVAVLGVSAYRTAWRRPKATLGPQPIALGGAALWVLPNPSGLNAHHQLPDLARRFRELATQVP